MLYKIERRNTNRPAHIKRSRVTVVIPSSGEEIKESKDTDNNFYGLMFSKIVLEVLRPISNYRWLFNNFRKMTLEGVREEIYLYLLPYLFLRSGIPWILKDK